MAFPPTDCVLRGHCFGLSQLVGKGRVLLAVEIYEKKGHQRPVNGAVTPIQHFSRSNQEAANVKTKAAMKELRQPASVLLEV